MKSLLKGTNSLRFDFWVLIALIFGSLPFIFAFHMRPLISGIFFFVVPTVYLCIRQPKPWKRILAGTAFIGVCLGLLFNIIVSANRGWDEVSSQLVFNYRLFGFWPVDEPVWFILWALFVFVFYEHFFDRESKGRISKRFLYFFIPTLFVFVGVLLTFWLNNQALRFGYAYFFSAIPIFFPLVYVLRKDPNLFMKFFKTSAFFFMLYLLYEITAMKLGSWYFPGQYIGWVELMGIRFPLEELIFWMSVSTFGVLSLYEFSVDDEK